jgi:hypothetical protein
MPDLGQRQHPGTDFPRNQSDLDDWAGLLTSGSTYWPRLPVIAQITVAFAAVVPGHSGGTATDSHRLPYSLAGTVPASTPIDTDDRKRDLTGVNSG